MDSRGVRGCKEVYRFPHISYLSLLFMYMFVFEAASFIKKNVFHSCPGTFCN